MDCRLSRSFNVRAGMILMPVGTLCGLRLRRPLLHDGSAATIEEAIGRHRNEADRALSL